MFKLLFVVAIVLPTVCALTIYVLQRRAWRERIYGLRNQYKAVGVSLVSASFVAMGIAFGYSLGSVPQRVEYTEERSLSGGDDDDEDEDEDGENSII